MTSGTGAVAREEIERNRDTSSCTITDTASARSAVEAIAMTFNDLVIRYCAPSPTLHAWDRTSRIEVA